MPSELPRLPEEIELSIFRIVQECLTNVHRHAGSPTAAIRIVQEDSLVRVDIEDNGKGISGEKQLAFGAKAQTGIGIRGMRERLRQLNGTLEVGFNGCGSASIVKETATDFWQNADHISGVQSDSAPKEPTKRISRQLPQTDIGIGRRLSLSSLPSGDRHCGGF